MSTLAQPTSRTPIIDVRGVGKSYPQRRGAAKTVLADVHLTVDPGEFVSLVGASGCGKTTLLRMVGGLVSYEPGVIRVNDSVVKSVPRRIGFVFQDSALLPWRTIEENVAVGLNEYRKELSKGEAAERVKAQLELVGLSEYATYLPGQISGGMKQRAGLARALVGEPDVLLMDEPFGALDAFTRMRLQEELAVITRRTTATTLFVTHDVDEAVFLSDRVAVMSANPGTVTEIVEIDLPRPRVDRQDLLGNSRAAELRDRVLGMVIGSRASQQSLTSQGER